MEAFVIMVVDFFHDSENYVMEIGATRLPSFNDKASLKSFINLIVGKPLAGTAPAPSSQA